MNAETPVTIDEFMRRALYDPRRGYYARHISGIGRRGDFTTVPTLDDALARAVAHWAGRALRETGCRALIEIGPGEGRLAAAVWKRLPPLLRWRCRLHLVETSAPLREIQRRLLGRRARWHESPGAALEACGGRAVIFSNELVDAFPARVFEKTAGGWHEVAVGFDAEGQPRECLLAEAALPPSSSFAIDHPAGQRVEVHDSYRAWLEEWMPRWRAGRMLTIDYGAAAGEIYRRRPCGSLRGYLMQQRIEGPAVYANPGRQDLTADVNFTDLIDWSAPWTRDSRLATLAGFLRTPGNGRPLSPAIEEIGGAFLALDQQCAGGTRCQSRKGK